MKRTLKVTIGILFSIGLFYLFIKDVNQISIPQNSGYGYGVGKQVNKVLYVSDIDNFKPGDILKISSDSMKEKTTATVESLHLSDQGYPYLVTRDAFSEALEVEDNPKIHFPRLQRALVNANYWWLLPCLLFTVLALLVRAYRWKFFFTEYEQLSFQSLWRSVCIGYMANNVLPFRMGEIVRAWVFGRKEKRKTTEVFGTIVLERIFDILSILILYVAFVFYFSTLEAVTLPKEMVYGAWVMGVVAMGALVFLIILKYWPRVTRNAINVLLKPFPEKTTRSINHLIDSFIEGLWIFDSLKCIAVTFGLSMIIWLLLAVSYLFVFYAIGIKCTLLVSLFLIVALAFAVSIPSAPGFIGTFHWVGQQVLLLMGLQGNVEAYVLIAHLMAYIPVVILGFFYLSLENISLKEIRENAMKIAQESETVS